MSLPAEKRNIIINHSGLSVWTVGYESWWHLGLVTVELQDGSLLGLILMVYNVYQTFQWSEFSLAGGGDEVVFIIIIIVIYYLPSLTGSRLFVCFLIIQSSQPFIINLLVRTQWPAGTQGWTTRAWAGGGRDYQDFVLHKISEARWCFSPQFDNLINRSRAIFIN